MKSASHHHQAIYWAGGAERDARGGEDIVERGLDGGDLFGLLVGEVELEVGLGDAHIVTIGEGGEFGDELPVVALAHLLHGVAVLIFAEGGGGGHVAGVEDGPGPDTAVELAGAVEGGEVLLRLGELPVGHLAHGDADGMGVTAGERLASGPGSSG